MHATETPGDPLRARIAQLEAENRQLRERLREREQLTPPLPDRELDRLHGLEQRVRERTAELEAAVRELEAFSYSVSHDLRAPLRAMDGFARILEEDFADQLPPEATRYLRVIRDNAHQMGRLIDDLLTFSRVGRHPLTSQPVDVAQLVRAALDDVRPQFGDRRIEVRVGALPPCRGDRSLLKQVFLNLLANAVKFTRPRDAAVIEIDHRPELAEPGRHVYAVRDNGVGFDPRYAGKLFGVFQRLHRPTEFEGTGVGLAIVHRIVHRHGGRAWAESRPDHGATFFVALPAGE